MGMAFNAASGSRQSPGTGSLRASSPATRSRDSISGGLTDLLPDPAVPLKTESHATAEVKPLNLLIREPSVESLDGNSVRGRRLEDWELPQSADFDDEVEGSCMKQMRRWMTEVVFGRNNANPFDPEASFAGGLSASLRIDQDKSAKRLMRADTFAVRRPRVQHKHVISPDNSWLLIWEQFIMLISAYSAFITPFEFAFFNVAPSGLRIADGVFNVFFLCDVVLTFFVAFMDKKNYVFVDDHRRIAVRYLKGFFLLDILGIVPWDVFYVASGPDFYGWQQVFRWMLWVRVPRARKVLQFFKTLQRDIRLSYFMVRIVKLLTTEMYITHVAGCIFYFLALTYPPEDEGLTWIGSLTLGGTEYTGFREMDLFTVYITSLYWSVVTMATIGYGDIHPVNPREMIFAMIYISFDLILSAYLVGNITALVVKGSNTTRYREKMAALIKYMNRNHLPPGLKKQMRRHVRLQYETEQVEDEILEEFPLSIRHKVSRALYRQRIESCYLFQGCSPEFVNQVVARAVPEYFFPSEVVMCQRDAAEHMYIVESGSLIEEGTAARAAELEGTEVEGKDLIKGQDHPIYPGDVFGDVALLCNIPQPFTVCASPTELCQLLRVDRDTLNSISSQFIIDGRRVVENLLARTNEEGSRFAPLRSEIQGLVAQQEAELTMTTIYAASRGDLSHLKDLIKAGANPSKSDYDGRSPLHLAAAGGFEEVVRMLLLEGADPNCRDNFGTTPLLEALRAGNDSVAKILLDKGGAVNLQEAGTDLCNAVINGDTGLLKRLLDYGVDPNSADYDLRTPLHIASAEGFLQVTKVLVEHGADVAARDRWGNTPVDEARNCGSLPLMRYLDDALAKKQGRAGGRRSRALSRASSNASLAVQEDVLGAAAAAAAQETQASAPGPGGPAVAEAGAATADEPLATAAPASEHVFVPINEAPAPGAAAAPSPTVPDSAVSRPAFPSSASAGATPASAHGAHRASPAIGARAPSPAFSSLAAEGFNFTPASSRPPSTQPSPMSSPGRRRAYGGAPRRGGMARGGGPPTALTPLSFGQGPDGQKRVTVYPFPPWSKRQRRVGKVMWLPDSLPELLAIANASFKRTDLGHVMGADGGEIDSLELVLDSDRLYLASDKDVEEENALEEE